MSSMLPYAAFDADNHYYEALLTNVCCRAK